MSEFIEFLQQQTGMRFDTVDNGQIRPLDHRDPNNYWGITEEEAVWLSAMAAGRKVIEIGMASGVSTIAMSRTAERIDTVDPDSWCERVKLPENCRWHRTVSALTGPYDFAFIDDGHSTHDVIRDINDCAPRLSPSGFMAFHDVILPGVLPGMMKFEWKWLITLPTATKLTFGKLKR